MKIKKYVAYFLYKYFAVHLPVSYEFGGKIAKKIRGALIRLMLSECGKNINIERGAVFSSKCTIGDNSGIGVRARLGVVYIGNNVLMGEDCVIVTRNHNYINRNELVLNQGYENDRPVQIGDDVWIGHRVIICPGVKIATGTVVGAGSVVTKDTEPYSVVAGNPARIIKYRL